jgi:hypothetical protein
VSPTYHRGGPCHDRSPSSPASGPTCH